MMLVSSSIFDQSCRLTKALSYLNRIFLLWKHVALFVLQRRTTSRSQREKDNREAESMLTVAGPKGDTEWERVLDYVNFGFTRPNGSDLSRMKGLLFSAKSKNIPVKSKS